MGVVSVADTWTVYRSNYVRVKDPESFNALLEKFHVHEAWQDEAGRWAFGTDATNVGLPSLYYDEELQDNVEVDFVQAVATTRARCSISTLATSMTGRSGSSASVQRKRSIDVCDRH
jgi:hypothetical protein